MEEGGGELCHATTIIADLAAATRPLCWEEKTNLVILLAEAEFLKMFKLSRLRAFSTQRKLLQAIKTAEQLLKKGKELGRLEYIANAVALIEPHIDILPDNIPKAQFFDLYGDCQYAQFKLLSEQPAIDALDRALIFREQAFYASAESPETGPRYLHTWAFNLREHFKASGDIQQLFRSINAFKSAADLATQYGKDPSLHLANLSDACREFCDFHFDEEIRSTGIDSARHALSIIDQEHPYRPNISFSLATLLSHEIASKDERQEGISLFESNLRNLPQDSPAYRLALSELINSLICQYEVTQNEDFLIAADKCVTYLHRQSGKVLHPDTGYSFGRVLTEAHKVTGKVDERDKAISLLSPLLELDLPNRLRWNAARCLASCLKSAYEDDIGNLDILRSALSAAEIAQDAMKSVHFGRGEDLDDWLFLCQEAYERLGSLHYLEHGVATGVKLVSSQHKSDTKVSPSLFDKIGCLFALRYQQFRRFDDIEHSALAFGAALGASPSDADPKTIALRTHNLGLATKDMGLHLKLTPQIENGVKYLRDAISLSPDDDPFSSKYKFELGMTLIKLGELNHSKAHGEEGLALIETALRLVSSADPDLPRYQMMQAAALEIQQQLTGDASLLDQAIALASKAIDSVGPNHSEYLGWLLNIAYLNETAHRLAPDKYPIADIVAAFEKPRLGAANKLRRGLIDQSTSKIANKATTHLIALHALEDDCDAIIGLIEDATGNLLHRSGPIQYESPFGLASSDRRLFARAAGIAMGNDDFKTEHDDYVGFGSPDAETYREVEKRTLPAQNLEQDYRVLGLDVRKALSKWANDNDASFVYLVPNRKLNYTLAIIIHPRRVAAGEVELLRLTDFTLDHIHKIAFGSLDEGSGLMGDAILENFKDFGSESLVDSGWLGTRYFCRMSRRSTLELGKKWHQTVEIVLAELGERLLSPIADALRSLDCRRVVLCGTGILNSMPIHSALLDGGTPFCELFDTSIVPSARAVNSYSNLTAKRIGATRYFACANPDGTLPMAELAALKIAAVSPADSVSACGSDATADSLREYAPLSNLVHISCHADVNVMSPFASKLLLGNDALGNPSSVSVGQLFGGEIKLVEGSTVILDCCDTSLPDNPVSTDEQPSFVTAFLSTGAGTVIGAFWEIDDVCTSLLVGFAVEERTNGHNWSTALAISARKLREMTAAEIAEIVQRDLEFMRQRIRVQPPQMVSDEAFDRHYTIIDKLLTLQAHMKHLPATTRPFAHPYYWAGLCVFGMQ